MNSTNKKDPEARDVPRSNRLAGATQFKPAVAQLKTGVSSQSVKSPVAPTVYRPQTLPRVLQTKKSSAQNAPPGGPGSQPPAPPIYRPQATKTAAQPKTPNGVVNRKLPVAPPIYRPQTVPKVLQAKSGSPQNPHAGRAADDRRVGRMASTLNRVPAFGVLQLSNQKQKAQDKERRQAQEKARIEQSKKALKKNADAVPEHEKQEKQEKLDRRMKKGQEKAEENEKLKKLVQSANTSGSMTCLLEVGEKQYRGTSGKRKGQGSIPANVWVHVTPFENLNDEDLEDSCFGSNCAEIDCIRKFYADADPNRPADLRGAVFTAFNGITIRGPCRTCKATIAAIGASFTKA
jgi:hypothetical protein